MLESLAARLGEPGGPHHRAPDKTPERRLATLEAAGKARIPFTTGLLVGFGETREERVDTLLAIDASHRRHGHVQEVIVQNFLPKPGTGMAHEPPCPEEEMLWTTAVARLLLDPAIHLQAPPNLASDLGALVAAGIDDWGGVSPVTPDHVNPERPWPELDRLRLATEAAGKVLAPRLTVYPEYVCRPEEWLHADVRFPVLCASDGEGLAREGAWAAGGHELPQDCPRPGRDAAGGRAGRRGARRRGARPAGRRGRDRHAARRPGAGAGRRLRAGRRPAAEGGRRRRHLRPEPQHQLHQRLHVQVPLLRLLQGSAVAQPPGRPLPPRLRGDPAPGGRGGGVRRHRGLPPGRHPPELRRRLLPRGDPGGEGRRPGHPRARLHRPRGQRGRPPARDGPARIPGPAQGRRPGHAARHGGRDPRRRGAGGHLPRQGHHRRMARGPPGRPLDRAAVQRHDHVRPRRAAGARGPPPRTGPGPAGRDRRVHRGGAPAVRAHGQPDLPAEEVPARADVPGDARSSTPCPASPWPASSTTSSAPG